MFGFNKLVRFQRFEKCKIHKFSGGACPRSLTKETHSLGKHKLESSVLVLLVSKKRFGVGKMRVCLRIERITEARIRTNKHSFKQSC